MKVNFRAPLIALAIGVMWSGLASAAILNGAPTIASPPQTVVNESPTAGNSPSMSTGLGTSHLPITIIPYPTGIGGGHHPSIPTPAPTSVVGSNLVSVVAEGCAMPKLSATRHAFYVDPVHGKITNDGSQKSPWSTFSEVVTKNLIASAKYPNAPIKPGDIIYLLSGNHGSAQLQNYVNSDFITVQAAPGQTPIITSLDLRGDQKWLFSGIKFQSLAVGQFDKLVNLSTASNAPFAQSKDMIFDNNTFSSQDNVSNWTQSDWLSKATYLGFGTDGRDHGTTCNTITDNQFSNLRYGVGITGDHTLFAGNTINNYADDGLDFAANDLVIANNTITNNHKLGDGNHNDAMQGQVGFFQFYKNIMITGNLVIDQTDPALPFPGDVQGISAFDSDWTNLTVTNNTVIVNAYHGISFASVHHGLIANNTVLPSSATTTWIALSSKTHEGLPSDDVVVRNNITWNIMSDMDIGIFNNNIVGRQIAAKFDGVSKWMMAQGTYGNNNVIVPNFLQGFVKFDPAKKVYDLHWVAKSPFKAGYGSTLPVMINVK